MLTSTGFFFYIGSNGTINQVDKFRYCDEALKPKGTPWPPNPGCIGLKPSNCKNGDEFGKVKMIYTTTDLNWDDMKNESLGLSDCKELCRKNCSCVAYTTVSYDNIGCQIIIYGQIHNLLLNIEEYSGGDHPYFVRQSILREKEIVLYRIISLAPTIGPLGLSPKKIGEDIAKETAKEWKSLRVTVKLTVQNRQAKVSVIPSVAALVI
ncbi:hypothetical protein ACFE04_009709 [Oxalis oulophora]